MSSSSIDKIFDRRLLSFHGTHRTADNGGLFPAVRATTTAYGGRRDHGLFGTDCAHGTGQVEIVGKGIRGFPGGAAMRGNFVHHAIDLFEGETLGFGHEGPGEQGAEHAGGTPDEEDLDAQVAVLLVDHVRGDDGDDAVPEPVRGGRQGDALGADL